MRHSVVLACGAAVVWMVAATPAPSRAAAGAAGDSDYTAVAARAAAGDLDAARVLRAAGPAGLSALVDAGVVAGGHDGAAEVADPAFEQALDLVCAQADCAASHLYWYTDFAAARAEAERSGKPILLLRLLGRLDEQLSCANSRYFRLVLYSDPGIAGWLRENAVLYWTSERPVPKVTVDFGDGRQLVGTVTGNSIHYMLDPHGRLVDAMPGLHTPQRFLAWLQGASVWARQWAPLDDGAYAARLRQQHERAGEQLEADLMKALVERGWSESSARTAWGVPEPPATSPPTAAEAARLAVSKADAEGPVLIAVGQTPLPPLSSNAVFALKLTRQWNTRLSAATRALVSSRAPAAARDDLDAALLRLEGRLAEDGVRNEAFLHRAIHQELARAYGLWTWQDLNVWVYTALFLTPASDPWLGLAPTELLGALQPIAPVAESAVASAVRTASP